MLSYAFLLYVNIRTLVHFPRAVAQGNSGNYFNPCFLLIWKRSLTFHSIISQ